MARATRPLPQRGEVYGCWTILRESARKWTNRAWLCRASCCGVERVKQHSDILRAAPTCSACKGNGKGGTSHRFAVEA